MLCFNEDLRKENSGRPMEGKKKIKELSLLRFGRNIPRKVFEKGPLTE